MKQIDVIDFEGLTDWRVEGEHEGDHRFTVVLSYGRRHETGSIPVSEYNQLCRMLPKPGRPCLPEPETIAALHRVRSPRRGF